MAAIQTLSHFGIYRGIPTLVPQSTTPLSGDRKEYRKVLLLHGMQIVQSLPTTQIGQTRPQGDGRGQVVGRRRA